MYILHHFPLCPFSRLARLLLAEKQLDFKLVEEKFWLKTIELAKLNPSFELPVLQTEKHSICSIYAISEFLEAISPSVKFLSEDVFENTEIRRLTSWFNQKFYQEVTKYLLQEKIVSNYLGTVSPRMNFIRAAGINLNSHLDYIEFLLAKRKWLAGDVLTLADLAAASQISVIDYLGDINWDKYHHAKEWYAVMKSRPGFRPLLIDRIRGFVPPAHYQNLDF